MIRWYIRALLPLFDSVTLAPSPFFSIFPALTPTLFLAPPALSRRRAVHQLSALVLVSTLSFSLSLSPTHSLSRLSSPPPLPHHLIAVPLADSLPCFRAPLPAAPSRCLAALPLADYLPRFWWLIILGKSSS